MRVIIGFLLLIASALHIAYLAGRAGQIVELLLKSPLAASAFLCGILFSLFLRSMGWKSEMIHASQRRIMYALGLPTILPYLVPLLAIVLVVLSCFLKLRIAKLMLQGAAGFHFGEHFINSIANPSRRELRQMCC